jgi:signal transduction histidine kinase
MRARTLDAYRSRMRGPRWASSSSPPSILVDLGAAVLVTTFLLLVTSHIPADTDERSLDALGWAALIVAGSSIGLCRRNPGLAVGMSTAALAVYVVREYVGGPVYLTVWVALFALAWQARRRVAFAAAAAVVVLLGTASALAGHAAIPLQLVFLGWSAAAVFLGDSLRNRRSYLAQLEERARVLELSREQEARRRVAEDRLRIAQDLHDSVAHAMATINVQAGAAAHVVDRRPEAAREALSAIRQASGEVLDELATLLGVLRDSSDLAAADPDGQPALGSLPRLVHTTRRAGLPVSLEMTGPLDAVPHDVGVAAYRIVQESLTNVLRHAGPVSTSVDLNCSADGSLAVSVDNEPAAHDSDRSPGIGPGDSGGLGIRGMQERATATGGRVRTGSKGDGGFSVCATWAGDR